MKKKILLPAILSAFVFVCVFSYINFIKRTKGFSVKKILSEHSYSPRWDFGSPSDEQCALLDALASEPFTLIGSGKECYAFVNTSGTYVIKFFKQKHMRTQSALDYLPLAKHLKMLYQETVNRRQNHRNRLFTSYQIAYERLPFQTGVLYLHLNKTHHLKKTLHLLEPSGKKHTLDLDNMEFLVQKRAYSILETLSALMEDHQEERARACIHSILDLITERRALGIGDDDLNCTHNLGLIEEKAVQIDVGEFYLTLPTVPTRDDFTAATDDLRRYLELHYPQLATDLADAIERHSHVL
jgi:hypothetical protein